MRTRMYGGVRGRKTKVGGKSTFVFLLLDFSGDRVHFSYENARDTPKFLGIKCILPPPKKNLYSVTYPHAPNELPVFDGSQMVTKKPLRRVAINITLEIPL